MLDPIYTNIRLAPSRRPYVAAAGTEPLKEEELVKDWKSFGRMLCPIILRLGLHIHTDVILFTKVSLTFLPKMQ